jgi:hypothetical protein
LNKGVSNGSKTPSKGVGNPNSEQERICMDWSWCTSKARQPWRRLCQEKIDPEVHQKLVQVWDTMPGKFDTGGFDSDNVYWDGDNSYIFRKGNLVVPREAQSMLIDWLRKQKRNEGQDDRVVRDLWKNYWWPTIAKDTIPLLSPEGRKTLKTDLIDNSPEGCDEKECREICGQPRMPSYTVTTAIGATELKKYICKKCNGQIGKQDREGNPVVRRRKIRTHEASLQHVAQIDVACRSTDDINFDDDVANDDEWSKEEIYGSSGALKIEVKARVAPFGNRQRERLSKALIDCGATGEHMHKEYASKNEYRLRPLKEPIALYNVDGTRNRVGEITYYIKAYMKIGVHQETIRFFVSDIGNHDIILGMRWLRKHDPTIGWRDATVKLDKCGGDCYLTKGTQSLVIGRRTEVSVNEIDPEQWTWAKYRRQVNAPGHVEKEPKSWEVEPDNTTIRSQESAKFRRGDKETVQDGQEKRFRRSATISRLSEEFLEANDWLTKATETVRRLSPSIDLAAKSYEKNAQWRVLPRHYEEFGKVFSEQEFDQFPPSRVWDHEIQLCPDAQPYSATRAYVLTREEQVAQDAFLDEMLRSGKIQPSKSPWAAPFFFVRKKDGKLRPVQDYRQLNTCTVKSKYPLPLVSEIFAGLDRTKVFTKLDVRWGFNNVRIKPEDCHKAAFRTNRGLFEPTVMFFGLTNSPATFQTMMNELFHDLIVEGKVKVYMDDILIATATVDENRHVTVQVLQILQDANLYLKLEKCEFEKSEIEYLGLIISEGQAAMDPVKVDGVRSWPTPRKLRDVRAFLGFCNFYRRFILGYATIAKPLT